MINARILVRKGLKADFDPTKMLPGEWAVSIDSSTSNQIVWMCFAPGVCKRMGTYEDFQNMVYNATGQIIERYEDAFGSILEEVNTNAEAVSANTDIVLVAKSDIINTYLPQIKSYVSNASASASEAKTYSENAKASASEADKSAEDAKKYSQNAFSTTPEGYEVLVGDVDLLKNSIIQTTERTLYGSNAGGIKLIGIGGASEQGENPSPDNPQEIESVGDIKNLLDLSGLVEATSAGIIFTPEYTGGLLTSISAKGTLTGKAEYILGKGIAIADWLKAGDYILSAEENPPGAYIYIYFHIYSNEACTTVVKANYLYDEPITISILEEYITNGYYIKSGIVAANGTEIDSNFKPMLRKASVSNAEYKPYGYSLGIKAEGKNKFTGWVMGGYINPNTGAFTTSDVDACRTDYIEFDPTKSYFLSGIRCIDGSVAFGFTAYYDENKKYISRQSAAIYADRRLQQVPSNAKYTAITAYYNSDKAPNFSLAKVNHEVQLEEGAVATPYEPYRSKSITIPLNEPLRGIGDIRDEVICQYGVWGVLRKIGSDVLNGSEAWNVNTTYGYYTAPMFENMRAFSNVVCNYFRNDRNNGIWVGSAAIAIQPFGGMTTSSEIKTWVTENPVTVQYELATPTFEPFTDQTPFYGLESFDTVTYISTDSEVEPSIELKFAKTEGDAITLGNYNRTKRNEIHISELMALQTELAAALVAGSEV